MRHAPSDYSNQGEPFRGGPKLAPGHHWVPARDGLIPEVVLLSTTHCEVGFEWIMGIYQRGSALRPSLAPRADAKSPERERPEFESTNKQTRLRFSNPFESHSLVCM